MASSVQQVLMHAWQHVGDEAQGRGKNTFSVHTKADSQLTSHPLILKCRHE